MNHVKDAKELVNTLKSGNFKLGALLTLLNKMKLWGLVELYFNRQIDKVLSTLPEFARKNVDKVLVELANYKAKYPTKFIQLHSISINTRDYNNSAIYGMLFFILKCPEALRAIMKSIISVGSIYYGVREPMPLPTKAAWDIIATGARASLGYDSMNEMFASLDVNIHKVIDKFIDESKNITGDVDFDNVKALVDMFSGPILKIVNGVDPIGIIMPAITFVWANIIERANKGETRIISRTERIIRRVLIVAAIIIAIVVYCRKKNSKENYFNHYYRLTYPTYLVDPVPPDQAQQ